MEYVKLSLQEYDRLKAVESLTREEISDEIKDRTKYYRARKCLFRVIPE